MESSVETKAPLLARATVAVGGAGGRAVANGRGNHESCRSRDVRRRLEVIHKKISDLQELGVPCAFVHVSMLSAQSVFTMGDEAITKIIQDNSDAILQNLSVKALPPLSAPLEDMNLSELRALVAGLLKSLHIKWSDTKPSFWPADVPFQNPRAIPDDFKGTLAQIIVHHCHQLMDKNLGMYIII